MSAAFKRNVNFKCVLKLNCLLTANQEELINLSSSNMSTTKSY